MARGGGVGEPLAAILRAVAAGRVPPLLATRFDASAGEDLVGRDALVRAVRNAVVGEGPAEFAETVFETPSVDLLEILEAASEISLLSQKRLVLVRGSRLAGGGTEGPEEDGEDEAGGAAEASGRSRTSTGARERGGDALRLSALAHYQERAAASACILFVGCPWDGRRRVHKAVLGAATVVDVGRPPAAEIPAWVERRVRESGGRIDGDAAAALAELRGNDTLRLASEIEKLLLHAGGSAPITRPDVLALVGQSEATSAWALGEALAEGDLHNGVQALRRLLAEGHAAPMIVGAVAARLRQLVVLRDETLTGRPNEAARKVVFPGRSIFFADKLARSCVRAPSGCFSDALRRLYDVDKRSKSSGVDAGALLEEWFVRTLQSMHSVRS